MEQLSIVKDGYHHIKLCLNLRSADRSHFNNHSDFSASLDALIDSEVAQALTSRNFDNQKDGSILAELCQTYTSGDIKEK